MHNAFRLCAHMLSARDDVASISAYIPLKHKTKTDAKGTGWPWGGVLASARRAVDDPLGSRRGAFSWQALNP